MIVYPASAEKATCPVTGCVCADRVPRYPSDMTEAEWEVLAPQARAVMAELRRGPGGRPMAHRLRVVVDAIRYLVRYGVEWRRCRRTSRRGRCAVPESASLSIAAVADQLSRVELPDPVTLVPARTMPNPVGGR